LPGLKKLWK